MNEKKELKMGKEKTNWLNSDTTAENEVLPGYVKWAWSSRALSLVVNTTLVAQITFFCTDVLKMPAGMVGVLLLISKIFDGFTDLIAGYIIDKTDTRIGKARPYEIFIVFTWLLTVFLFSAPNLSLTGKAIYVFVLYSLINSVCHTFLDGADAVYLRRSIRNDRNRVGVVAFSSSLVLISTIVVFIVQPQMLKSIGTSHSGWMRMTVMFAIPLAVIGMLRFVLVKEVVNKEAVTEKKQAKVPIPDMLRCLFKNKYIWIIGAVSFLANLHLNTYGSVSNYYFKYIVGDIGVGSLAAATNLVTPILMIFYPAISKKLGNGNLLRLSAVCCIVGALIRLIGGTAKAAIMVGTIFTTVSFIPASFMISIYLIDCMTYGEWKSGIKLEGMTTSVTAFLNKIAKGLSSGLVGLIMGLAGYDGALEIQTKSANSAIIGLYNVLPFVIGIIALVVSIFYRLDKELPGIKEELEARNKDI